MPAPPGCKHVMVPVETHAQLKEFKESEGGRHIPEVIRDIVEEAYQRRFFSSKRKQAAHLKRKQKKQEVANV